MFLAQQLKYAIYWLGSILNAKSEQKHLLGLDSLRNGALLGPIV